MEKPRLSIIIVSYNVRDLLVDCIRSVIGTISGFSYEIIVVDNASSDGSVEALKEAFPQIPQIRVIANSENVGFARANNQGYEISHGDFLLLLNPDTIVKPNAIRNTLQFLKETSDGGMACCRLLNSDGSLQKSIAVFPSLRNHILRTLFLDRLVYPANRSKTYYKERPFKIDYGSGAFMVIRKEALGEISLMDEDFFMYAEEKDLALRLLERGWHTYFVPSAEAIHYGGRSTDQMIVEMFIELQRSQVKFFRRHYSGMLYAAMAWTYGLHLWSSFLVSVFGAGTDYGRLRLRLFARAAIIYPQVVRELTNRA